ncbi:phosphoribosylanthranilate isomerase [Nitratidesulfovibrio sp. SRB-5]|uniref:phosphoribosylanthranilate isomerase n=1 Tax=Nitratidesulfovibrio sp. SRB-5 TaxID=2872636 RepID=UPI0010259496|nr:phosphoribosylanthranilate isomerase [Nitratidesulfovibrio sp. SRB-5]MBZ2172097.1 phosphoribosylanthranilate isomerase [Nitratidesulfovibrio sp. SRB-5]RXF77058.1 phosphoribosylanthranilate isomerase [Desulfovibrio sp. DS-1]
MSSSKPATLFDAPSRLLVKVCGLTRQQDADACAEAGVDLCGFIFHPASPRAVTPAVAAGLHSHGLARVGVFVKQSADEVLAIMDATRLDFAQLHGGQDAAFCDRVGPERVIRAAWPQRHADRSALQAELAGLAPHVHCFLLDAGTSGGGHGATMDWSALRGLAPGAPWLLAGGLTPDNVAGAVAACGGHDPGALIGVDLNSGVESAPGQKDATRVAAALAALRAA